MSLFIKIGVSFLAASFGVGATTNAFKSNFPPEGKQEILSGDKILVDGKERTFIGYFGGSKDTIENKMDINNRSLFYGDKKTAQRYAFMHRDPHLAIVVGDDSPGLADHGAQSFEGPHAPLDPQGMKRLNVSVISHEEVNSKNRIGLVGSVLRAIERR